MSQSLKIGLVFDDSLDRPDGVQQYVLALGAWLSDQGHEVHYLVGETERTDIPHLHSLSRNVSVKFNQNRMRMPLPASGVKLKRFLARQKFDVLHIQMPYSPFLGGRILQAAPAETVIVGTFHIVPYSRLVAAGNHLLALWTWRSRRRLDAVMSVSTAAADFAKRVYHLDSQIVPNLVDIKRFRAAKPQPHDGLTILYLGRLVPRKGCQTLLEAVAELRGQTLPAYNVQIAGRGPLEDGLKRYAAENEIDSSVNFLGFVDEADKPGLLANADITVFPSNGGESFGIVLVEAMASGSSVVLAGDNSGYRTVMGNFPKTLFSPTDSHLLAEKLSYYLTHQSERQALAAKLRQTAENYDCDVVGQQVVKLYRHRLQAKAS